MTALAAGERRAVWELARLAVDHAVREGRPLPIDDAELSSPLRAPRACFVTLRTDDGALRGCVGSLEPRGSLALELSRAAHQAARRDPRFPPVEPAELPGLHLHVSVLSPPTSLPVADEAEALATLRPGVDGVTLRDGGRRATFLPDVWTQLPDPRAFLARLKRKAGLPADHWSPTTRLETYTTESIDEPSPCDPP